MERVFAKRRLRLSKVSWLVLCLSALGAGFFHSAYAQDADYSSPEATFRTYMAACKAQSFERVDMCYTREFRRFQKKDKRYMAYRNVGQLRNMHGYLAGKRYKLELYGHKAIMRFSPEGVRPEPLYFVRESGKWKLDGMFSFKNVKIQDSRTWYWQDHTIDNEAKWLRQR